MGIPTPRVTPVAGLADRLDPAVVATSHELFVFGGEKPAPPGSYDDRPIRFFNDGMLIDIESGAADALPEPPFERPLASPAAVKVGDTVVVLGGLCIASQPPEGNATFCEPGTYAAATFDLKARTWQSVEIPAELRTVKQGFRTPIGATEDGRAIFQLGPASQYWAYSPGTNRWDLLKSGGSSETQACIADHQLVELTTAPTAGTVVPTLTALDLATGTDVPAAPLVGVQYQPYIAGRLACLDREVLVLDPGGPGRTGVHRYDLDARTWSTIPEAPVSRFGFDPLWTGDELVFMPSAGVLGQPALVLDPGTGEWTTIADPPPISTNATWNGTEIVGYAEPLPVVIRDRPAPKPCIAAVTGPSTPPTTFDCPPAPAPDVQHYETGVFRFPIGASSAAETLQDPSGVKPRT